MNRVRSLGKTGVFVTKYGVWCATGLLVATSVAVLGQVAGQATGAATGQASGSAVLQPRSEAVSTATPTPSLPKTSGEGFPAVNPKNFTASSPTVETVNEFLHALWGLDGNRVWSVAAIEPTIAPGVVRVQVYVAEKTQPSKIGQTVLYVTPDGKHAIAGEVVNFGAKPFEDTRQLLQQQANGPARGAASKDLELVEFADLQCTACKAAQATMDQLVQDFPQARVIYENLPLTAVHPYAFQAAAIGHCVRQAKGDPAFFAYASKVYDTQADLTKDKADATLRAAVTASGADAGAAMACASAPAAQDAVNATLKLASTVGVSNTPTLVINGRALAMSQISYEGLARVVVYQGSLDGIAVKQQPHLTTLK